MSIPAVATDFAYVVITGSVVFNAKVNPKTQVGLKRPLLLAYYYRSLYRDTHTRTAFGLTILKMLISQKNFKRVPR